MPEVTSSTFTWMSGWVLFHTLTDWEMPGTHVQKLRVTLPLLLLLLPLLLLAGAVLLLLQAASARAPAAAVAASRSLRRNRALRPAPRINDVIVLLPPKLLQPHAARRPERINCAVPEALLWYGSGALPATVGTGAPDGR